MSTRLESIEFFNEHYVGSTPYLLGNIGDKITIESTIAVDEVFVTEGVADVDRIMLNPSPFRVDTPDVDDIIYCEKDIFSVYNVGDKIRYFDTVTTSVEFTIYEIINGQTIRVYLSVIGDVDFPATVVQDFSFATNSYIYLSSALEYISYSYNFVDSQGLPTLNNLIDSSVAELSAEGLDATDLVTQVPMVFSLPETNNIGSAYAVGAGISVSGVTQRFKVVHETVITPIFLAGQINDLKNNVPASYLDSDNTLKYISSFDVGRAANDPNSIKTITLNELESNVGGFGENFNGNATTYSKESVVYKKAITLDAIDSLEATSLEQTIEIEVLNSDPIGHPFTTSTPFVLNFQLAPDSPNQYTNNANDITTNFRFDRVRNIVSLAVQPGDNFGTENQVFKEVSAALDITNPTEKIIITAKVELSTEVVADLASRPTVEYLLWAAVQDDALALESSDRTNVLLDIQPFVFDNSDDGIVIGTNKFLKHYESDVETEGSTNLIVRPEDDVLSFSRFYIDRLTREDDDIEITNVGVELLARKSDGSEFTLERFSQSLSGTLVVGDSQYIDVTIPRIFKMPDGDQRKQIVVKRRSDLDTADFRYYDIQYPFLMRWEYWTALAGVNSDAFDINESNNGLNNDWQRFDTLTDWDIYYKTTVSLLKNGNPIVTEFENSLSTNDYTLDSDWINENIETFNANSGAPFNGLINGSTRVLASMEYAGVGALTTDDVEWVIRVEIKEQGGVPDIRYFSSVYDWSQLSWFTSLDSSNKVIKSIDGVTQKAEVLIDSADLPDNAEFSISARIYDKSAATECCLLKEDGDSILMEDEVDCLAPEDC